MKSAITLATTTLTLAVGAAALTSPLRAQVTEIARTPIAEAAQITFGYLCDDRFVIRNDGTKPIDLEYGVEKGTEHTRLALNARESVELASTSKEAMELWMDGKLIAKALKEQRSCKDVQGNAAVSVAPLDVSSRSASARPAYGYGFGMPYPFYDPWGYYYYGAYGSIGFRPYIGAVIRYPIIIGGGGHRGGGRRGR